MLDARENHERIEPRGRRGAHPWHAHQAAQAAEWAMRGPVENDPVRERRSDARKGVELRGRRSVHVQPASHMSAVVGAAPRLRDRRLHDAPRRSDRRVADYRGLSRARNPFPPGLPWASCVRRGRVGGGKLPLEIWLPRAWCKPRETWCGGRRVVWGVGAKHPHGRSQERNASHEHERLVLWRE